MSKTNISWTDYSWNVVTGCTKVSAGCKNCYAEGVAERFWKKDRYGRTHFKCTEYKEKIVYKLRKFTDVRTHPERLDEPLHIRKPSKIMVCSMGDLFHPDVPFEFIDKVWEVMSADMILKKGRTPDNCEMEEEDFRPVTKHIYQILTKRPERMLEYFKYALDKAREKYAYDNLCEVPLPNVWLGVSVENQKAADERIPILLQVPASKRFLSLEPLLEPITLTYIVHEDNIIAIDVLRGLCGVPFPHQEISSKVDWVITGCESGSNKRECKIEYIKNIVEQCKAADVPVFIKQVNIDGKVVKDINEFPEHLRIQQYPEGK